MKKLLFAVFAILGFIACGQKSPAPASNVRTNLATQPITDWPVTDVLTLYSSCCLLKAAILTPSTSFAPTSNDRYTDAHALATNWLSFSIRKTSRRL